MGETFTEKDLIDAIEVMKQNRVPGPYEVYTSENPKPLPFLEPTVKEKRLFREQGIKKGCWL